MLHFSVEDGKKRRVGGSGREGVDVELLLELREGGGKEGGKEGARMGGAHRVGRDPHAPDRQWEGQKREDEHRAGEKGKLKCG